ncbi:MAG: ATP-binding cassette domain-containing protein [Firmicutes bacterium]|nr:ABC transporter ATP-binding protein [Alicyclobacillaceae bacterium]MCL6497902.1 ATP-binding cassette domain-containing protein [Bacillota bacterium]
MAATLEAQGFAVGIGAEALVSGLTFRLSAGGGLAVMGPSGSGKTTLGLALAGLARPPAWARGSLRFCGQELVGRPESLWKAVRGQGIAVTGFDPARGLHPLWTVERQLAAALRRRGQHQSVRTWMAAWGLDADWAGLFPHELSSGMRVRVGVALALAMAPAVLVADEPSRGLDARHRSWLVEVLSRYRAQGGILLLLTHDQELVTRLALPVEPIGSRSEGWAPKPLPMPLAGHTSSPVLRWDGVTVSFPRAGGGTTLAVQDVRLAMNAGERLLVVGESGAGKSTLARLAAGLIRPTEGAMWLNHRPWPDRDPKRRRLVQMVHQDARAALSPALTVRALLEEPLHIHRIGDVASRRRQVQAWAEALEIPSTWLARRPSALSDGQCRRVALARALVLGPELLVLDEPLAGLDARGREAVAELLHAVSRRFGAGLLWVEHAPAEVVAAFDRLAVMHRGRLVEWGPAWTVWHDPYHPFTDALRRGRSPMGAGPPLRGCGWASECPWATARCRAEVPALRALGPDRAVACHHLP